MTFKFNIGAKVRDRGTGFDGIIIARIEWLNGCIQYSLQSEKLQEDGRTAEVELFEEQQLDLVRNASVRDRTMCLAALNRDVCLVLQQPRRAAPGVTGL